MTKRESYSLSDREAVNTTLKLEIYTNQTVVIMSELFTVSSTLLVMWVASSAWSGDLAFTCALPFKKKF
jgi:hypothetical protein